MRLLSLLTTALIALSSFYTNGFCIYNEHSDDTSVYISQTDGYGGKKSARFSQDNIRPNETQCCHYSNTDCNKSGKPDEIVKFLVRRLDGGGYDVDHYDITCPGGGYIIFRGNKQNPTLLVKWADGRDFPYLIDGKKLIEGQRPGYPPIVRRNQISYESEALHPIMHMDETYRNRGGDKGDRVSPATTLTHRASPTLQSNLNRKRRLTAHHIVQL